MWKVNFKCTSCGGNTSKVKDRLTICANCGTEYSSDIRSKEPNENTTVSKNIKYLIFGIITLVLIVLNGSLIHNTYTSIPNLINMHPITWVSLGAMHVVVLVISWLIYDKLLKGWVER